MTTLILLPFNFTSWTLYTGFRFNVILRSWFYVSNFLLWFTKNKNKVVYTRWICRPNWIQIYITQLLSAKQMLNLSSRKKKYFKQWFVTYINYLVEWRLTHWILLFKNGSSQVELGRARSKQKKMSHSYIEHLFRLGLSLV